MKEKLLTNAVDLSIEKGYRHLTRKQIALRSRVSVALISYHFKNMNELRREIVIRAVSDRVVAILAQVLANRDPLMTFIPNSLRRKAANYLLK